MRGRVQVEYAVNEWYFEFSDRDGDDGEDESVCELKDDCSFRVHDICDHHVHHFFVLIVDYNISVAPPPLRL